MANERFDHDVVAATAFIAIPPAAAGPEGIAISARRHRAYIHLQHGQVAAINLDRRTITDTWQSDVTPRTASRASTSNAVYCSRAAAQTARSR